MLIIESSLPGGFAERQFQEAGGGRPGGGERGVGGLLKQQKCVVSQPLRL